MNSTYRQQIYDVQKELECDALGIIFFEIFMNSKWNDIQQPGYAFIRNQKIKCLLWTSKLTHQNTDGKDKLHLLPQRSTENISFNAQCSNIF